MNLKKYIGDKAFYKMVLAVAVPIMIQNGITSFVGMLDNIMVGQMGTLPMSGVAIVNQVLFVFNLCVFGGMSGIGIFSAQFAGKGDLEGIRSTLQFKLILSLILTLVGTLIFGLFGPQLIQLYLKGEADPVSTAQTMEYGKEYFNAMLWGLLPFVVAQAYASTLRETGETVVPMVGGIAAVLLNLLLNYVLIFGHFGFKPMGVRGAAIATNVSRVVEMLIVVLWPHIFVKKNAYIKGLFTKFTFGKRLVTQVILKGTPLMFNELLWSAGMAIVNQCYSMRGLDAVAAINISSTISNVFGVVHMALGIAVGIIVGQQLGAGEMEKAKDTDNKMIAFATVGCLAVGVALFFVAPFFPAIYNTSDVVRDLATGLIRVTAVALPAYSFANACYFTLRSGGKTGITFLFDCAFVWCITMPAALIMAYFTHVPIVTMFALCQAMDLIKCIFGWYLVHKGDWINSLVEV